MSDRNVAVKHMGVKFIVFTTLGFCSVKAIKIKIWKLLKKNALSK